MVLFRWTDLIKSRDLIKSQAGLGIGGVILVAFSVAGGLGCSALVSSSEVLCSMGICIKFNASTTQILPFLAMGMGVNAIFMMTYTYADMLESATVPQEVRIFYIKSIMGFRVVTFPDKM